MSSEFDDMPPLVDRPPLPTAPNFFILPPPDDDDLPPLVDQPLTLPNNAPPLTFTFSSYEPNNGALVPAPRAHAKKREADHIPRPPNAFILFRASFVKAQAIPNKVVSGSHASLSKIVGMIWKQMNKDERYHWEQEAVRALAEHRERYPDWRFRMAGNGNNSGGSVGKMKEGRTTGRKRKGKRDEDEDERNEGRGGGGKRRRGREKDRFEHIASLVKKGMTGDALASAVTVWDSVATGNDEPKLPLAPSAIVPEVEPASFVIADPAVQCSLGPPLTSMHRRTASLPRSQSPPPFIPTTPPPALPLTPVTYVPAQESFADSALFGNYAPPASHLQDLPYGHYSPTKSASPVSAASLSPTSVFSDRRGSFDSLTSSSVDDTLAHSPFQAPTFDPYVAVYDPSNSPAPVDPFAFDAFADYKFGDQVSYSNYDQSPMGSYMDGGVPKYPSFGWDTAPVHFA